MLTKAPTAACLLLAALSTGCAQVAASPDRGTTPVAATPPLDDTAWVLAALPGQALVGGHPVTVRFEDGHAQGSDGCNRYSHRYTAAGATLEVAAPGIATQMACAPEVIQQAEAFRAALAGATTYRVADGRLQLLGGDGKVLATFAPQSQALPGTAWRAIGINNGRGAVVSVVHGSTVTLEFGTDQRAGGSAGCNAYTAGFEADGPALRFTPPASTRKMCPGEGIMEQEQAFLGALAAVTSARFEGDRLELRTADGALAAAFLRDERE